jgi:speckle-type POZ protein
VQVQYDLRFVDDDEDEASPLDSTEVTRFKSYEAYGEARFFRRTELERSRHLRDDAFTIQCDMLVIEFAAAEVSPATVPVPPSNLQQHLRKLLESEHGADVVFQVGGETLAAHRWLLAVRSPVFNAELFGAMKESSTGVVLVDDMEAAVFRALLYFIYTDLLPEMNHGEEEYVMSQHLLVASDKYNLERLKFICQQNLCKHIEASNVTFIFELAEQHQCHALKNACFEFLSTPAHLEAALATDSFKCMSRNCPSIMMELVAKLGTQAAKPSNISSFPQFY